MSNAALAFLAGLGQGYFQGKDNQDKKARQAKQDQREQEEHQSRMSEQRKKQAGDAAIAQAARPMVAAAGGMSRPDTMDDRDVGLPENAALPNGGLAATATANTPEAVAGRQVAALQGIDPERAHRLESNTLNLENARAERTRRLKEEGLFDAMRAFRSGDVAGMKDAFNKGGQFKIDGDVTMTPEERDIPGIGKVTTYNATFNTLGPDGKPVSRTFNSHDLSMQLMPYEKALDVLNKGKKTVQEGQKAAADADESQARAGYYRAAAGEKDAKATGATGKPLKLDEDDKLRLTSANQRVRDAEKAVVDAMGKLMPGEDAGANQGVAFAQKLLREAKLNHLKTGIELGQVQPASMVTQIMSVAKTPAEVMKSLGELASVAGTEYSDQVAAAIQSSDAWKAMNPAPRAGAKPKAAAAQGMPSEKAPAAAPSPAAAPAQADASEVAGQKLDAARQRLRALQASAPGLAKGREAIASHAAQVEQARAALRTAEGEYQRLVSGQTSRAYFGRPAAATGVAAAGL
jgi:hypothetical protein